MKFPGTWLVFIITASSGNFIQTLDGSLQKDDSVPTCGELKDFWDIVSRSVRMSQLTNEIPLIPVEAFTFIDNQQKPGMGRQSRLRNSHRSNVKDIFSGEIDISDPFGNFEPNIIQAGAMSNPFTSPLRYHADHETPSNHELHGGFDKFHTPPSGQSSTAPKWEEDSENVLFRSTSGNTGPAKGVLTEEVFVPSWGMPEEVGMFGQFLDLDGDSAHIAKTRVPKHSLGEWSELPLAAEPSFLYQNIAQVSCSATVNKGCTIDQQCECSGHLTLRCIHGRCTSHEGIDGNTHRFGNWHDAPLPISKLGIFKRLRRNNKSTFM